MKAIVYEQYGPPEVLQLKEVEKPTPKKNEVLINVHATTTTAAEGLMRRADAFYERAILGLRKPRRKILGLEFAGEITEVGQHVTQFKEGDQVYGFTGFRLGAYAEYCCMPETGSLAHKPTNVTYEEAAAIVDGASTALFFLRDKAHIQKGQQVLINGASGSIGTAAVQLARYFGADVTGVCSGTNIDLVKSLGANQVIDYTKEDFSQNGIAYDIIFDTVGKSSFSRCKGVLKANGVYLTTTPSMNSLLHMLQTSLGNGKKAITAMSIEKREALQFIKTLIEAAHIKPVIDKRYSMGQIVEAHRYVDTGHKKGNVVITIANNSKTG